MADEAEVDVPLCCPCEPFGGKGRLRVGRHRRSRLGQERLTGRRQRDPARVARQQHHAEFALELGHRLGEGGLGHVQACGRARYLALLGNRHEVVEMAASEGHGWEARLGAGRTDRSLPVPQAPVIVLFMCGSEPAGHGAPKA